MNISISKNKPYDYIRNHKFQFLIFCSLLVAFFLIILPSFAGAKDSFANLAKSMAADIFAGGLTTTVKDIILANPVTEYPEAWGVIENVYTGVILPIAFGLLTIHLIIGIIQQSIRLDQLTWQQLIKPFLSFFAAWFVMKNGLNILLILIQICQEIAAGIGTGTDSNMNSLLDATNQFIDSKATGIFEALGLIIQLIIPWIFSFIISLAVKIVCYTRIFELYLKTMIAPFGMSDLITKGIDGSGMRFFKNYFATCLQGAIIIAISIIYGAIMSSGLGSSDPGSITSVIGLVGTSLVMSFAAVTMMFKAGQIAKEVLGA